MTAIGSLTDWVNAPAIPDLICVPINTDIELLILFFNKLICDVDVKYLYPCSA
jgi:hypothetical protein